jgi:MoaA/NifB/PqqE/SkfB family radical SAM enzyme
MLNPNPDAQFLTAPTPKILWIELTSKCPFDCIFCTRRTRFGAGRHLDFEIFRRVVSELESPDFIGLNYSGESIHYPRLIEAIELAADTGASTEVVTAFSSVSAPLLRAIVESPLDRLAVSLHTMDAQQYQEIYKFGSLDALKRRVDEFLELRSKLGKTRPRLDFCFVAMHDNLHQLGPVVEYARNAGAVELDIHPIIGRHLIPRDFSRELSANRLRNEFKDSLRRMIHAVEEVHPGFAINVLNPDIDPDPRLSHSPGYYSPLLPENARIFTCDQDPFVSVHILAGGNVVVCEVLDEISMGNLNDQPLREIWHSQAYLEFRQKYVTGAHPECRSCVWKKAYLPATWSAVIDAANGMNQQLLRGWHSHDGESVLWSTNHALLALDNPQGHKAIRIAGILPHAEDGEINSLSIRCNHADVGECRNPSKNFVDIEDTFSLPDVWERVYVELRIAHPYRPSSHGSSLDCRDLGFALQRIELLGPGSTSAK